MRHTHAILIDSNDMSVTPRVLDIYGQLSKQDVDLLCHILDKYEEEPVSVTGSLLVETDNVTRARILSRWIRRMDEILLFSVE